MPKKENKMPFYVSVSCACGEQSFAFVNLLYAHGEHTKR